MAKLTYTAITSLDGYIEDERGGFDWAVPDPEVHAFVNDLERAVGTYLYGRRMYETMAVWQTIGLQPAGAPPAEAAPPPEEVDFAEVWRAADKVVYSRTLDATSTPRTRLEREFDPETVRRMKDAADRDLSVSGPGLAQHASRPDWWTRSTCSCSQSSSVAASRACPGASAWTSSCSRSGGSATGSSTCAMRGGEARREKLGPAVHPPSRRSTTRRPTPPWPMPAS